MNVTTLKTIVAVAVMVVLSACEDGPSGIHPSTELDQLRRRGAPFNDSYTVRLAGHGILSGDSVVMQAVTYDTGFVTYGTLLSSTTINVQNSSVDRVSIRSEEILSAATTISSWKMGAISMSGLGVTANMTSGPSINYDGVTYFGTSGSVVITNVSKDATLVYSIEGYINGTFQSIWPKGFAPSTQKPVPDGFNVQSPSLVGDKLTVHSLRFRTTMASGVRYAQ